VGSGDHTPFDHLPHQWTFGPIADIDAPPCRGGKRLAPGLHAVPGTRGPTSLPTLLWERRFQITDRCVRGDRQQRALVQGRQATPEPVRTPHLVIPGHPPMTERGPVFRQPLQGPLVTRAIGPGRFGHTRFVQARRILGPFFRQRQPCVDQGVPLAGDLSQGDGHLAVIDLTQATTPLSGYPHRLPTGCGKPARIAHQPPIALAQVPRDLVSQLPS
jgi:hypothetical protein